MMIQYQVRPVTRYIATRYHETEYSSGCENRGEFENEETAYQVAYALCKAEHDKAGTPIDDMSFIYPKSIGEARRPGVDVRRDAVL